MQKYLNQERKTSEKTVSSMTRKNNFTMSSRSQSRSIKQQKSTKALVSEISRDRTRQALKHDHTQFVCNALRVWKIFDGMESIKASIMWSMRFKPKTKFNTCYSCWRIDQGKRTRTLLQFLSFLQYLSSFFLPIFLISVLALQLLRVVLVWDTQLEVVLLCRDTGQSGVQGLLLWLVGYVGTNCRLDAEICRLVLRLSRDAWKHTCSELVFLVRYALLSLYHIL